MVKEDYRLLTNRRKWQIGIALFPSDKLVLYTTRKINEIINSFKTV